MDTTITLKSISSKSVQEILQSFNSDAAAGLTSLESQGRLAAHGFNILDTQKKMSLFGDILQHFKSPLVLLLLFATSISYAVGEVINASIIFLMVLASVAIDFFQERDARNAAEKLKLLVKAKVVVCRDGVEQEVLPQQLCMGDIILLNAGKIVPADVRVIMAKDFFINQSSLTGESFPCEKYAAAIAEATDDLSTMDNIAFMGSSVISGSARGLVVKTGSDTEFGKIAVKLIARPEQTTFSRGMHDFGYLIMRVTIALVLFIFLINALLKHDILESFMFSIAIAVGLTPELLPMIMSLTMSKGSLKMAKRGVIVKHLSAIPNFGSMEVLCTDKTGTLTEDKIELIKYVDINGTSSDYVFELAYLNSFHQTGIKNPLDDAILQHKKLDINAWQKTDEIPFDFYRKRMSVVVSNGKGKTLICKGAPEELLKECIKDSATYDKAMGHYSALSRDGFRVLAIAIKAAVDQEKYSKADETGLSFAGFVAFLDPPKQDVAGVILGLQGIGVEVKIITGDNHLVTQKICHDIGLKIKGLMQGFEMDTVTDDALRKRVVDTTIFCRFSPDQKNRIIHALKANHKSVGYMGDGINDAPSLQAADIGISVNSATDVAKESADIILTQKSLLVLKDGILEGRKTFGNTMKYVLMGLSSNFGNMFSVAAATLFLPFLPMLPVQILINNFLYDASQISIPSDNVDDSYIKLPQRWDFKMIYRFMFIYGITSSVFDLFTFWLLYSHFSVSEAQFRTGWFMESLATQIMVVFIIRTQQVPFFSSKPSLKLGISTCICLCLGWLLPYLPFSRNLGFAPLPWLVMGYIVGLVLLYLFSAELVKRLIYRRLNRE